MKRIILLAFVILATISGCVATINFDPVSPLPIPRPVELPAHIDAYQIVGDTRAVNVTCAGRQVAIIEQYPDRILVVCAGPTATPTATSTFVPEPTDTPYPTEFATPIPTELATLLPTPDVPVATLTPTAALPTVTPTPAATGACLIKGNVNSNGTKLYFLPDHRYYDTITITPSAGEMWFCDAASAEAAGFARAP